MNYYVRVLQKNILYTYDTRQFPIRSRISNQYVMVAYHSSNDILVDPFYSRTYKNWLEYYNTIVQRFKEKNLLFDLHIWDNECSKEYQVTMR